MTRIVPLHALVLRITYNPPTDVHIARNLRTGKSYEIPRPSVSGKLGQLLDELKHETMDPDKGKYRRWK